jgi:hypothetical protein
MHTRYLVCKQLAYWCKCKTRRSSLLVQRLAHTQGLILLCCNLPCCIGAVPPLSGGFTDYWTIFDPDTVSLTELQAALPRIIAANLGLPSSYPLDLITVTFVVQTGSGRHLLATTLLVTFTLQPSPLLPPVAELQTRFDSRSTTEGVAADLAASVPSLGASSTIARSTTSGTPEELPKPIEGEQACVCAGTQTMPACHRTSCQLVVMLQLVQHHAVLTAALFHSGLLCEAGAHARQRHHLLQRHHHGYV